MTYDLSSSLAQQSARTRLEYLIKKGSVVEMTEKKKQRSLPQNAYLHLLLGYLASQLGERLEYVKLQYYKCVCNPDIYISEREDKLLGRVKYIRSSAELSTDEMSLSIDRLRNWAADTAGIHLPDAMNQAEIAELQIEVENYKTYLY